MRLGTSRGRASPAYKQEKAAQALSDSLRGAKRDRAGQVATIAGGMILDCLPAAIE